jgi:hypothetical protein
MKTSTTVKVLFAACSALTLVATPSVRASQGITTVYSKVSDDYVRATSADGSPQNETYAFGDGGYYSAPIHDDTIDHLSFRDIAHTLAVPLENQHFVPAKDPSKTGQLIMVYWGATSGPDDFAADRFGTGPHFTSYETSGLLLSMSRERNAGILGYGDELAKYGLGRRFEQSDINEELDSSRYFVVLMAYDFQSMWKEKKHKLLWEARFSIREQGNDFTVALPAMAQYASEFFGRDSHGLLRTRVPDGRIYMGDPTVIEFLSGETETRH